jgi:hypothetical protein
VVRDVVDDALQYLGVPYDQAEDRQAKPRSVVATRR